MKGSILDKYSTAKPSESQTPQSAETEGLEDLGAFGFLRGIRDRAIMLELRYRDGRMSAFSYAWLSKCTFDGTDEITLNFGAETVKIKGQHLNGEIRPNVRLISAIVRHRVSWIQEADGPTAMQAPKGATVIEEIEVT